MKDKICTNCGYVGKPTSQGLDSFLVDGLIWLIVISFTAVTMFLPLLLIPFAWSIYHIAMYNKVACPKCENLDMVRIKNSPPELSVTYTQDTVETLSKAA